MQGSRLCRRNTRLAGRCDMTEAEEAVEVDDLLKHL